MSRDGAGSNTVEQYETYPRAKSPNVGTPANTGKAEAPAAALAKMLAHDLGVGVSAINLELFVIARWRRLSALAHAIKDGDECRSHDSDGKVD